jgi:tetratricopeptide (TPR) repeat protein
MGLLLVAAASGFGAYSLTRVARGGSSAGRAGTPGSKGPMTVASPPAVPMPYGRPLAQELLAARRTGDDAFAPTLQRPRRDLTHAALAAWAAALPAGIADDAALRPLIDEWALLARSRGDASTEAELAARLARSDADPIRSAIRAAVAQIDPAAMRALAFQSFDAGWPGETDLLLARSAAALGIDDLALRTIERRLVAAPDDFAANLLAAELLARDPPAGLIRARDQAAVARALDPQSRRALLVAAELELRTADGAPQAVALLQAAVRAQPDVAALECATGVALLAARFFDEARGRLERAVELDPTLARAVAGVAAAWFGVEEYYRAIGACRRSLEIADNPEARDLLATIYLDTRNRERAWTALDEAIAAWPEDAAILDHHSASLGLRGRPAEGLAGLKRAVHLEPWNPEFLNDYAWELVNSADPALRRPGQGLEIAQRVCAIDPGNSWYVNTLGVAWYRSDEPARAVEVLDAACDLPRGGGPFDHYFLAMAHQRLGDGATAGAHFEEALLLHDRRDPEMERVREEARTLLALPDETRDG